MFKRKVFKVLAAIGLVVIIIGCSPGDYDDSKLKNQINDLDARVSALEQWQETVNSDIAGFAELLAAEAAKEYITAVTENADKTAFVISFLSGKTITISNGTNGINGSTPNISAVNESGVWYWTIDGAKIGDGAGGFIKASGTNGITPLIWIDDADGTWKISFDYTISGSDTIINSSIATGKTAVGTDGDAFFASVDNSNSDFVEFVLADATTTFSVPKYGELEMLFEQPETFIAGEKQIIDIELLGGVSEITFVDVLSGWSFAVNTDKTQIEITAPQEIDGQNGEGVVTVLASDGKSRTIFKRINIISEGAVKTINNIECVLVRAGTFMMGSPADEEGRDSDETQHEVTLTKDYWVGKYEITQEQYEAVIGSNPSYFKAETDPDYGDGSNKPVERVNWETAVAFCEAVGNGCRLPTEAEWEFAARGGNKGKNSGNIYSGSNTAGDVAWHSANSGSKTQPVGTKAPNELGIYDMSGNVWEWVSDVCGDYGSTSQTDPTGPSSGSYRVVRGGSWFDYATYCRVAYRGCDTPSNSFNILGFRVVFPVD